MDTEAVFDSEVYGETFYEALLFDTDVYGDGLLQDTADTVSLSAVVTGAATVAANVKRAAALSAAPAGAASVTAALVATQPLSSVSAGSASVSAALTRSVPLAAQSSGAATVAGTLARVVSLSAASAGSAIVAAAVNRSSGLSAASVGSASVSSLLSARVALSAQIGGGTSVSANANGGTQATSIVIGGIQVASSSIALGREALASLEAAPPETPILVDMALRTPHFVGTQPQSAELTLPFFLLETSYAARRATYESLVTGLMASPLVEITWSLGDGIIKTLTVVITNIRPDAFFYRGVIMAVAPDAVPLAA